MWEIALLIIAIAFAVAVGFTIPILLQLWASAKELEFTLRETRETVSRLRSITEKAEVVIDKGYEVVSGAQRAVVAVDGILGEQGTRFLSKTLITVLEFIPVALTVKKFFNRFWRRKDHV